MTVAARKRVEPRDDAIAITRVVRAAPDKVFEAWTDAGHLSQWWGPRDGRRDFSTPRVEVDLRPGGAFRTCIRSPRGDDYWARGTYSEIDPPRRLAFSHAWENERGEARHERTVTVDFAETGARTRVAFRIAGFRSLAERDGEIEGWNQCLDRLVRYFAEETPEKEE